MQPLLTAGLCLALIVALLVRHAKQRPATKTAPGPSASRRKLSLSRTSRRQTTNASETPFQPRYRPRLALTVSGLPAADNAVDQAGIDAEAHEVDAPLDEAEPSPAAWSAPAVGQYEVTDALVSDETGDEGQAPDQIAADEAAVTQETAPILIEAPGWPQPGEMAYVVESFDPVPSEPVDDTATPTSEPELTVVEAPVSADTDVEQFEPIRVWEDEAFDPTVGWVEGDAATGIPDALPEEWATDVPAEAHAMAGTALDAEIHSWDAPAETDAHAAWDEPEWSWDDSAATPDSPIVESTMIEATEVAREPSDPIPSTPTAGSWPAPEASIADEPGDPTLFEAPTEEPVAEEPAEVAAEVESAGVAETLAETPQALPFDPQIEDDGRPETPETIAPEAQPLAAAPPKRLAKRLDTAEAELRRLAKRTTAKKGDLRSAPKKPIAKRVAKVLADPEVARHFDVHVDKGRLSFERRSATLPVVTIGRAAHSAPPATAAQGAEILAALEVPLRASLLSNLLAEYANAEAARRVADVLRHHSVSSAASDNFDALVARLTELTQGPLLGLDPSSPEHD